MTLLAAAAVHGAETMSLKCLRLAPNLELLKFSLLKLTAAQNSGGDSIGLDLLTGEPNDTIKRGVLEPLNITRQAISGATEAAISILRIDDVLWAQMDAQIPDGVQEQLQGFGAE